MTELSNERLDNLYNSYAEDKAIQEAFGDGDYANESGDIMSIIAELKRLREAAEKLVATVDIQSARPDGQKFAVVYSSAMHALPDGVYHLFTAVPITSAERERLAKLEKLYAAYEEECAALKFNGCPVNAAYFRDTAARLEKELSAANERLAAYDRAAKEPVATITVEDGMLRYEKYKCSHLPDGEHQLFTAPPLPVVPDAIDAAMLQLSGNSEQLPPDSERGAYEAFMAARLGDTIDTRRAKNGDQENPDYMAWDMTVGWLAWQGRARCCRNNKK